MSAEEGPPGQHGFPLRLFAAAFAISLLVVAVGVGLSWQLQERLDELRARQSHLADYVSRIMLFDEALTMSARMAAATGRFYLHTKIRKIGCRAPRPDQQNEKHVAPTRGAAIR